jgi:hypothetical protein
MSKKRRPRASKQQDEEPELWLAPKYNLKGPSGERAWDNRIGGAPSQSRFLELADIAMGVKKPAPKKKPSSQHHDLIKREPYTS